MKDGKIVKLPYYEHRQIASTTGAKNFATFRLMGIFDPDYGVGGHQPYGHDQYSTFYNEYQVVGAKVVSRFTWHNPPSGSAIGVMCYAIPDEDTTLPTDVDTMVERYGLGSTRVLKPDSKATVTITTYFSAKKWYKMSKTALLAEHQLRAQFGADPFRTPYLNVGIQSLDGTSTSEPVHMENRIMYIVKLLEPKNILGS